MKVHAGATSVNGKVSAVMEDRQEGEDRTGAEWVPSKNVVKTKRRERKSAMCEMACLDACKEYHIVPRTQCDNHDRWMVIKLTERNNPWKISE